MCPTPAVRPTPMDETSKPPRRLVNDLHLRHQCQKLKATVMTRGNLVLSALQRSIAVLMICALTLFMSSRSFASVETTSQKTSPQALAAQQKEIRRKATEQRALMVKIERAIQKAEKHLQVANGQFILKAKRGADIGIDEEIFAQLNAAMQETNQELKSGKLKLSEVRQKTAISDELIREASDAELTPTLSELEELNQVKPEAKAAGCPGRNGIERHWWGGRIFMNKCRTVDLILAMQGGAAIAAIVALIPGPGTVGGGVALVMIELGAAYIGYLNDRNWDRGIRILYLKGGAITIWHQ